jgi:hypothetical protein
LQLFFDIVAYTLLCYEDIHVIKYLLNHLLVISQQLSLFELGLEFLWQSIQHPWILEQIFWNLLFERDLNLHLGLHLVNLLLFCLRLPQSECGSLVLEESKTIVVKQFDLLLIVSCFNFSLSLD